MYLGAQCALPLHPNMAENTETRHGTASFVSPAGRIYSWVSSATEQKQPIRLDVNDPAQLLNPVQEDITLSDGLLVLLVLLIRLRGHHNPPDLSRALE